MSNAAPTGRGPIFTRVSRSAVFVMALSFAATGQALDQELHVAPGGSDSAPGTAERPLATLRKAFELVAPGSTCTIRLAAGGYLEEGPSLELPLDVESLRIHGPGSGFAELRGSPGDALLALRSDRPITRSPAYGFSGLRLLDGERAISIDIPQSGKASVAISRCEFHGQKFQALELVAGEFGELDVSIADCRFTGSPLFAIDIGTRESAFVSLEVVGNRLESLRPDGDTAGVLPRSGIAVFADDEAEIRGRVTGNTLVDVGDGIVIATSDHVGKAGAIALDVTSNLAYGTQHEGRSGLEHGVALSLLSTHETHIRILHNTLVGGSGRGISVRTTGESGDCTGKEVEVAGNVLLAFAAGALGTAWIPSGPGEAAPALPECIRVWGNAVDGDRWDGTDQNFRAGAADFVDLAARDLLPREGSRLVDYRPVERLGEEIGSGDARGACRVADGDGDGVFSIDVGALELAEGARCVDELLEFVRGDCNGDDGVDISDSVRAFGHLFHAGVEVRCGDACDANDDGALNVSDGIYLLNYLFLSGPMPAQPFPGKGLDRTADALLCLIGSIDSGA